MAGFEVSIYGRFWVSIEGYVFNMDTLSIVEGPFRVAHGSGRGNRANPYSGVPRYFSNRNESYETSLGLFTISGGVFRAGAGGGNNAALSMVGRSNRFNDAAVRREIIRTRNAVARGYPGLATSAHFAAPAAEVPRTLLEDYRPSG